MQIIRQQNSTKSHFSIIPYGITMSKIFSFLFIVPNDSTISSFPLTRPSFTRSFILSILHSDTLLLVPFLHPKGTSLLFPSLLLKMNFYFCLLLLNDSTFLEFLGIF